MELRQLRAVLALDDVRHFGRAASALGISQSALSQSLRSLEAELGVTLFERTTRTVTATDAGTEFVARIAPAVAQLDGAVEQARAAGRGEAGSLAIGMLGSALLPPLPRVLRAYRARHPGVRVSIVELTTSEQAERLLAGSLDVGFLRPPLAAPAAQVMELVTVAEQPLVAVLPRGHRLAAAERIRVRSLAKEPFVRTPRALGPGFHDRITALCRQAGFEPHTVQEAVQIDTVVGLVAAGFGISIVPGTAGRRAHRDVAFVPLSPAATIELALAVPTDRPLSPPTEAFVALVRARTGRAATR